MMLYVYMDVFECSLNPYLCFLKQKSLTTALEIQHVHYSSSGNFRLLNISPVNFSCSPIFVARAYKKIFNC